MPTKANDLRAVRIAPAIVTSICLFTLTGYGQPFRVATWQVPDVPTVKGATNLSVSGQETVTDLAATLSGLDADAVILYGISDGQVLKRVGDAVKPKKLSVALHMTFRHGSSRGPIVGEPIAVLSPHQKMHSKTLDWSDSGRIDIPGGFGFATFKHGPSVVALYVAGLPGGLTNLTDPGQKDYISNKRGYAAQYMASHIAWLATTYTNSVFATYLTADINPGSKRALKDECVSLLEKSGFRTFQMGTAVDKSALSITNSQGLDRVLDPVFTRSVEFIASRQIARPAPEHPIVVCDLTLKAPGVAAVPAPPAKRSGSSSKPISIPQPSKPAPVAPPIPDPVISLASGSAVPTPDPKPVNPPAAAPTKAAVPPAGSVPSTSSESSPPLAANAAMVEASPSTSESILPNARWPLLREQWFAPVMAAGGAVLMAAVFFFAHATRRRQASLEVTPHPGDAVFVEVGPGGGSTDQGEIYPVEQTIVSEATTSTDNAHNGHRALWRTPRVDFGNQEHTDPVRAGLLAHVRHLMRDKLFSWLSQQRTQLIDSHEEGTRQVLGLEERLEKIREQFQDRLISQEERIAELDRELQAKERMITEANKENRGSRFPD